MGLRTRTWTSSRHYVADHRHENTRGRDSCCVSPGPCPGRGHAGAARELSPSCTEVSARSPFQRSALPSWTPVLTLPCRVHNLRPGRRKDPAPV